MNDLKYVIVQLNGKGTPRAIIFNGLINHSMVVCRPFIATSAGFCSLESTPAGFNIKVWGNSSSLNIKSNINDKDIIRKTLERNVEYF